MSIIGKILGIDASSIGGFNGGVGETSNYVLAPDTTNTGEGNTILFTVTTANIFDGTKIPYVITGVEAEDIDTPLSGFITILNNSALVSVAVIADSNTEGEQTMTFTAMGISSAITILDTSLAAVGLPYTRSMYLDGVTDRLSSDNYVVPTPDFSQMDSVFGNPANEWTIEKDFRIHKNDIAHNTMFFKYAVGSSNSSPRWNIALSLSANRFYLYVYYFPSTGGTSYTTLYTNILTTLPYHFPNLTGDGMWHRVSITKNTNTTPGVNTFSFYLNGVKQTNGSSFGSSTLGPWTPGSSDRFLEVAQQGADITIGAMSIYDRELTSTEIANLYDGGAYSGGSPDQSAIMNINPLTLPTVSNLIHYWYYDPNVDSDLLVSDKMGNTLPLKLFNNTLSAVSSITTPKVPFYNGATHPGTAYVGENIVIQGNPTSSGAVLQWYSDIGRTVLVNTGPTYSTTPPSLGSYTLYLKNTDNSVSQTSSLTYEVAYSNFSTHSIANPLRVLNGRRSSPLSPLSFINGSFTFSYWSLPVVYNSWQYPLDAEDNSNRNRVMLLHNVSTRIYFGATVNHSQFSDYTTFTDYGVWTHFTITYDTVNNQMILYINGVAAKTINDSRITSDIHHTGLKFGIPGNLTHMDNIAIHNNVLSASEVLDISGNGSGTVDITALSSASKIVEYWGIDGDTYDGNFDFISGLNGNNIPLNNNVNLNPTLKSTNRP